MEGHVSWDYEANGRINTQLGVCDRYVRSEAGARITGQCARDKYHGTSITGQVSRDKYHGDNGQKIMKCTHYFLWVFAYIFHYIQYVICIARMFHRYSEMSGVINYRLRGRSPHEPWGLQIFLGPCFLEEQERKDSFSQNNHFENSYSKGFSTHEPNIFRFSFYCVDSFSLCFLGEQERKGFL